MYPSHEALARLSEGTGRPVIMCEYSHAMGNSNGSLDEYWRIVRDENNRARGGFIWDWADQGIAKFHVSEESKTVRPYFAYGGDFNETLHDAQFCINGA